MESFHNIKVLEYHWRLALHLTSFFPCVTFPENRKVNDVMIQVLSRRNGSPDYYCSQVM